MYATPPYPHPAGYGYYAPQAPSGYRYPGTPAPQPSKAGHSRRASQQVPPNTTPAPPRRPPPDPRVLPDLRASQTPAPHHTPTATVRGSAIRYCSMYSSPLRKEHVSYFDNRSRGKPRYARAPEYERMRSGKQSRDVSIRGVDGPGTPDALVIGTDLQPTSEPPNVKFDVDDFESEWTFGLDEKLDFIHGRALEGSNFRRSQGTKWVCPSCGLQSSKDHESSFRRHLKAMHAEEIDPPADLPRKGVQRHINDMIRRAFCIPGDSKGLTSREAEYILQDGGPNVLMPPKKRHPIPKFLDSEDSEDWQSFIISQDTPRWSLPHAAMANPINAAKILPGPVAQLSLFPTSQPCSCCWRRTTLGSQNNLVYATRPWSVRSQTTPEDDMSTEDGQNWSFHLRRAFNPKRRSNA